MKKIGISAHVVEFNFRNKNIMLQDTLNRHYSDAVKKSNAIPIIIPNIADEILIKEYVRICDGFILSGGGDIDPKHFRDTKEDFIDINESELLLCKEILDSKKPLLGICRGLQVLNVVMGGSLIEDIPTEIETTVNHSGSKDRYHLEHEIEIDKNSILYKILKKDRIMTNSFHHQSIKRLGDDLVVSATHLPDKVIEAVEHKNNSSVIAVQWHPECMVDLDYTNLELFEYLVSKS